MSKVSNKELALAIAKAYNEGWDNYETAEYLGISYQGFMYRLKLFKNAGVEMPDLNLAKKMDVQKLSQILRENMNHVALPDVGVIK